MPAVAQQAKPEVAEFTMLSAPPPDEPREAQALRGKLFTDLDRLAFAIEMEAAALLEAGRAEEAETRQQMRLGVRLAQRLVAGVWANEVDERIHRWAAAYEARLGTMG